MRRGLEEVHNEVIFYSLDRLDAAASAVLNLEGIDGHSLDITKLRKCNNRLGIRDQILVLKILFIEAY